MLQAAERVTRFAFIMPLFDAFSVDEFIPCSTKDAVLYRVYFWDSDTQEWTEVYETEDYDAASRVAKRRHTVTCKRLGVRPD